MTTQTETPAPAGSRPDLRRVLVAPVALVAVVALVVGVVTAAASGALTPLLLGDTGPVVRYGLVVLRVLHDLSAALTIGLLLVAAFLTPEGRNTARRPTAAVAAAYTALAWALTAGLGMKSERGTSSSSTYVEPPVARMG